MAVRRCLTAAGAALAATVPAACGGADPRPVPSPTVAPTARACVTDRKLMPSCGMLWGAAAGGFSAVPRDRALRTWEDRTGRTVTIFHTYHRGDDVFPSPAEAAMTRDPTRPRVLLVNWRRRARRVATDAAPGGGWVWADAGVLAAAPSRSVGYRAIARRPPGGWHRRC
ncbi:hypothetical protein KRM28CT15_26460 [Krasilnikovia sp. M28-CT-15]